MDPSSDRQELEALAPSRLAAVERGTGIAGADAWSHLKDLLDKRRKEKRGRRRQLPGKWWIFWRSSTERSIVC